MKKILKYLSGIAVTGLALCLASVPASADDPDVTAATDVTTEAIVTTEVTTETQPVISDVTTDVSSDIDSGTVTTVPDSSESTTVSETTKVTVTRPDITDETILGWNNINGKWFYFNGNKFLTGVQKVDGDFYLFAKNGAMRTGWQTVNQKRRYYDYETHSPVYGWIEYHGEKYYNDVKTGKLIGMHEIDENFYIFNEKGIMCTGLTPYDGRMYYCNNDGIIQYGDDKKTLVLINGYYYYISPKGYVSCGWQTVNGLRYFYDYETGEPVFGWVSFKGNLYYVDKSVGKYTGVEYIGEYPYMFTEKGILSTGLQYFEEEDVTSYFYEDGTRAVNEIVCINNNNYYFDEKGYMKTGWITINNARYYFDKDGKMIFGMNTIDGKKYLFDQTGKLCVGLINYNNGLYFFDKDGVMQTGWQTFRGKTYYFDTKTGKACTGWNTIDGNKYYFNDDCSRITGKYVIDGNTYYFGSDGKMCTGWQTINNEKYYFSTDKATEGVMYTYRHIIDGINYLFYSTGVLALDGNQNIVAMALSQLGQEGGKPYWTWWGFNFRIEWCACFVSWCATQCGYTQDDQTPTFISCKVGIDWFKEHGQWKGKNYVPKSGDYIFFDWEPDGVADHIGIVDYYEDGYVYTVEGNSNDMVRKKVYDIKSENIYGFAAPDFLGGKDKN